MRKNAFNNNPTLFHEKKTLNKLEMKENFIHLIKGIFEKPSANIILNDKRPKTFPLR